MGGLAGIVHFRGASPSLLDVERIAQRQARRGPDDGGSWAEGEAAFAHRLRRLRPDTRPMPLVSDDLVILLDGWFYDIAGLARQIGAEDQPDREAMLLAWRRWGVDTLSRLEGEFALAVWDRRGRTLTLARDRLGIRPLHYAAQGEKLAFAGEVPPLLDLDWVSRELEPQRLAEYLSFGVVHAPRTLLRDVHQVEPGTWLVADRDGLRVRRYWTLKYAPPDTPKPREGEVIPRLQELVDRAVQKRVPAGVPTGLYLSGGLGSAAIASAARRKGYALPSFTVSFADDPYPESVFAGRVATLLGLESKEIVVRSAEIAGTWDASMAQLGQPIATPGVALQFALAREARTQVRVALSGDGGEELFGGRMLDGLGRALQAAQVWQRLPGVARAGARLFLDADRVERMSVPPRRFAVELGLGGANLFSTEDRSAILRDPGLVRPAVRSDVLGAFYADLDTDPINVVLHGFLRSALEIQLVRADRTAAASGLDVRFPLLDREVVEAAAALPGAFKQRRIAGSVHTRWPLRSLLAGELPEVLVDRPKRGPPAVPETWLAGAGRLFLEDRVERLKESRLWRTDAVEHLKADVGRSNAAASRLWALIALDSWLAGLAR